MSGPNTDPGIGPASEVTRVLEQVLARRDAGDFAGADGLLRKAQALAAERTLDDQAHVQLVEGMLYRDRGDADAAKRAYREAARITNPAHSPQGRRLHVQDVPRWAVCAATRANTTQLNATCTQRSPSPKLASGPTHSRSPVFSTN